MSSTRNKTPFFSIATFCIVTIGCNNRGNRQPVEILFVGDSDIENWQTDEYNDSDNVGVGGATCEDVIDDIDSLLADYTPDWVVLVCGENDMAMGRTVDTTFTDFQHLVEKSTTSGAKVVYMGTKPEPATIELHSMYQEYDQRIQDYAIGLSSAGSASLIMVDVYQGFEQLGNFNSLYAFDQLHLSNEGYEYWNTWLKTALSGSLCVVWTSNQCTIPEDTHR